MHIADLFWIDRITPELLSYATAMAAIGYYLGYTRRWTALLLFFILDGAGCYAAHFMLGLW